MKSVKAIKDFTLDGVDYIQGDNIEVNNIQQIVRLNEKGFIEPLSRKEIVLIQRQLNKKEEEL